MYVHAGYLIPALLTGFFCFFLFFLFHLQTLCKNVWRGNGGPIGTGSANYAHPGNSKANTVTLYVASVRTELFLVHSGQQSAVLAS